MTYWKNLVPSEAPTVENDDDYITARGLIHILDEVLADDGHPELQSDTDRDHALDLRAALQARVEAYDANRGSE